MLRIFDQCHHAAAPKPASVFAEVPPLIIGPACARGNVLLNLHFAFAAVFRCEEQVTALPKYFLLAPAENFLGPGAPAYDCIVGFQDDKCVVGGALHDDAETLVR